MKSGDVVGSRYRLVEPLAAGGMGTVWRARHVELDTAVAIKVMSDALVRAPTALVRFQREAKAAAQLRSPNVVQVFDYGVHDGQPYLAMELLDGEDLHQALQRLGPLPLGRAAQILEALCKALKVAHAAGIVHRDLKPANVFLHRAGDEETVKVLDFGIAKDLGEKADGLRTSTSTTVGSPLYMSPEQVRGGEIDHRTDLWAAAVLTYEMVTGIGPFEGQTLGDVFARIVSDPIPSASEMLPGLSPEIDAFFVRALARVPDERFASASELAAAFRESLGPDSVGVTLLRTPVLRAQANAGTIRMPTGGAAPAPAFVRVTPSPQVGADEMAPTERPMGDTGERARTAAMPSSREPALQIFHTDDDVGPVAERNPSQRRGRWVVAAIGVALVACIALAIHWARTPSPVAPAEPSARALPATSEAAPTPSSATSPSATPSVEPDAAHSSQRPSASATPSTTATPATTGPQRPPPRAATAAPSPTPATDPIFGVPLDGR